VITTSSYTWKSGNNWNRASHNAQGELIYPNGIYTFTVSQNLNGMEGVYKSAGITDVDGKLTNSTGVTFAQPIVVTSVPTTEAPVDTTKTTGVPEITGTIPPTSVSETPVPVKTTYSPMPAWIVMAGIGMAAAFVALQRR
jgi:hypothetical protein